MTRRFMHAQISELFVPRILHMCGLQSQRWWVQIQLSAKIFTCFHCSIMHSQFLLSKSSSFLTKFKVFWWVGTFFGRDPFSDVSEANWQFSLSFKKRLETFDWPKMPKNVQSQLNMYMFDIFLLVSGLPFFPSPSFSGVKKLNPKTISLEHVVLWSPDWRNNKRIQYRLSFSLHLFSPKIQNSNLSSSSQLETPGCKRVILWKKW